ncbi:MAG TPA: alpha/beta hydrolase [Burkholderiaceae bacterium]|nr:alpha/beta hydrolase [Burkholderiaceae bacterium]
MTLSCRLRIAASIAGLLWCAGVAAADPKPCHLKGVTHEALCGSVRRPLDPARPAGMQIDVHFAVLPALARNKLPDPVFFFAGGPGQSAIDLAGPVAAQLGRLNNRRDLVFVDQRGTGRSAPLRCETDGSVLQSLSEQFDPQRQLAELASCRERLLRLPHGDLRYYSTSIAMRDADAVRGALGAPLVNLVGASYGTRAALEFMRQFPRTVRRAVLDGVAPPDMVLPAAFSTDNQRALDNLFDWCATDAQCQARYPQLPAQWRAVLNGLPRQVRLANPLTGQPESMVLTRDEVLGMVRSPLYVPALAAALPAAISEAAAGRFDALAGLGSALSGPGPALYSGMHFSIVCSEDVPRMARATDLEGAQFGRAFAELYERACASWPRAEIDPAFYTIPVAPAATWLLSGAADPATPPRHGERVAQALGAKARHTVVPNAGHGVMALACVRDAVLRFIEAPDDAAALNVEQACAADLPHPRVFVPLGQAIPSPAR